MGWFGLFDLLRFPQDAGPAAGWAMPGSRLRLIDRHLAALYHGAVTDIGHGFHADTFDIASHHLARSSAPESGAFHVDMRMTGRPASMLFGSDHTQAILAWHAASATATVRLAGADPVVALPHADLAALLEQSLPIQQIATLSAWVEDFQGIEAAMKQLDPWLTTSTRAIIRMPQTALEAMLGRLPAWPARCVAVVPCSTAAEGAAGIEAVSDVIVCFQDVSQRSPMAVVDAARGRVRRLRAETWNDKSRAQRSVAQGGLEVRLPADRAKPGSGLPITLLGDAPATLAGASFAAMQARPFQATTGFDYLLDISAATISRRNGTLFVVPQRGPVVIDPQALPEADASGLSPESMRDFLASCGAGDDGWFVEQAKAPVGALAARPTFLMTPNAGPLDHMMASWPNLQLVFELCDLERLAVSEIDVLVPARPGHPDTAGWVIDSLLQSGFERSQIKHEFDGVLYRRLLLASPGCSSTGAQRAAGFDRFWNRYAASAGRAGFVSFSRARPSGKVLLVDEQTAPIVNGADLQAMARDRGYQIVNVAESALGEMVTALSAARVVVGPGSLLGWACLATQATLGLLHRDGDAALPYPALHAASARGHAVVVMFGTSIGSFVQSAFVVAPDRFAALLDRVELSGPARRTRPEVSV